MKKLIIGSFLAVASVGLFGQQMPVTNQYVFNPFLYNPAYAGLDTLANLFVGYKQQWSGIPDAPRTISATCEGPVFGKRIGFGGQVYSDQVHITNRLGLSLSFAYHLKFDAARKTLLSFGLSGGIFGQNVNFGNTTANLTTQNDNAIFGIATDATVFDFAAGVNFRHKGFNLSLSVPQLVNSQLTYADKADGPRSNGATYTLVRHFYSRASYRFRTGEYWWMEPGIMGRYTQGLPVQLDVNAIARYRDQFWCGLGWRSNNGALATAGLNASVGFNVMKLFNFTYTYESQLSEANRASFGHTHELLLGVKFGGAAKRMRELERKLSEVDVRMTYAVDSIITISREEADEMAVVRETIKDIVRNETDLDTRLEKSVQELDDAAELAARMEERVKTVERVVENGGPGVDRYKGGLRESLDTLGSVFFNVNDDDITNVSKTMLSRYAAKMVANKDVTKIQIYLFGNASEEGSEESNMILSLKRAKAVKKYLESLGIKSDYITIPMGEEKPVTTRQATEEERKQNRRVDIMIAK